MRVTWRRSTWLPCLLLMLGACRPTSALVPVESRATWPSPAAEEGVCADVGQARACFDGPRGGRARLVARPVPARAPSTVLGWRCVAQGSARVCIDRAREAPTFTCIGSRCRQRPPRLPDDGDWSCGDLDGAVVCAGSSASTGSSGAARAAGLPTALPAPGWQCGERRRQDELGPVTARICVDLSPDYPDGQPSGWRCHYDNLPAPARICERMEGRVSLGGACGAGSAPCPEGAACVAGRCLPPGPIADCWIDEDCPSGACRFGSCQEHK